jgi:hypothetical protein
MPLQAVQILRWKTDDTANIFEPFFFQLERHKSVIRRIEWQPEPESYFVADSNTLLPQALQE